MRFLLEPGSFLMDVANLSYLHSPQRQLIELRMAHADLDKLIDDAGVVPPQDELALRRLKKQRLQLRDRIAVLEALTNPREPA